MAAMMLTPPAVAVVVKPSSIHGLGLFAEQTIEPDTLIGVYEGPRVAPPGDDDSIGDHVLWIEDDRGCVFGIDGHNELRYVNHSANANAAFYGVELWSLRRIEPGEEITHHYGSDWEPSA